MTLEAAYEMRRREVLSLKSQVAKLQKALDQVSAGIYTPEEKVTHVKEICGLKQKLQHAEKERDRYHALWDRERNKALNLEFRMKALEKENADLKAENEKLRKQVASLKEHGSAEAEAKIQALSNEVGRLTAILNNDGTNSGTPTSKTPLSKKKAIPNAREKSGKKKGGQPGHEKHTLDPIAEGEVTEEEDHKMDNCPYCGSNDIEEVGHDDKDELDYEVHVIKKRHRYFKYVCKQCGKEFRSPVPLRLKEECQYGSSLQAMILSLLDLGFVSANRTKKLINGFFSGELNPCEAYIIGMQKKAANKLQDFSNDVKRMLLTQYVVHWDDTVIFINKSRSCMRFYGTEQLAWFTAHETKGRDGLDVDGLLAQLSANTHVMHDHNTVNYNPDFIFINIECNQHLQRDLQKLAEESNHQWAILLKEFISVTIHDRKQMQRAGETAFSDEYILKFNAKVDKLLQMGDEEYQQDHSKYYEEDERRLLNRLRKYRDNYFMWVTDFRLPTTNNLSERSLRFTKVHEKVSGQFESIEYARYFATIRTYLETCARNGVNEFTALQRLTQGNPYSLSEVLSNSDN